MKFLNLISILFVTAFLTACGGGGGGTTGGGTTGGGTTGTSTHDNSALNCVSASGGNFINACDFPVTVSYCFPNGVETNIGSHCNSPINLSNLERYFGLLRQLPAGDVQKYFESPQEKVRFGTCPQSAILMSDTDGNYGCAPQRDFSVFETDRVDYYLTSLPLSYSVGSSGDGDDDLNLNARNCLSEEGINIRNNCDFNVILHYCHPLGIDPNSSFESERVSNCGIGDDIKNPYYSSFQFIEPGETNTRLLYVSPRMEYAVCRRSASPIKIYSNKLTGEYQCLYEPISNIREDIEALPTFTGEGIEPVTFGTGGGGRIEIGNPVLEDGRVIDTRIRNGSNCVIGAGFTKTNLCDTTIVVYWCDRNTGDTSGFKCAPDPETDIRLNSDNQYFTGFMAVENGDTFSFDDGGTFASGVEFVYCAADADLLAIPLESVTFGGIYPLWECYK